MVARSLGSNMKQMNVVVYVMYVIYVMWMVAFLAVVSSKPTVEVGTDVVAEILRAIDGRQDMQRVAGYLNASRDDLAKQLPLLSSDGTKLSYTFFAPTSFAFTMQTPQDTVDPLFVDASLRNKVLIRHFARQSISSDDLAKLDKLVMADSREAVITRTADGKISIDNAEIQQGAIVLLQNLGNVYLVERVFMTGDEVSNAISAHFQNNPNTALCLGRPCSSIGGATVIAPPPAPSPSIPILGGFTSVSINDADVLEMARFATNALSVNKASPLVLIGVVKAEKQIVAGVNYRLQLKFNGQLESEENHFIDCQVTVFDQVWTATRQITSFQCTP
ncbi:uncharacterized protein LOC124343257 isoform X3 [Daphnia pulicaria]|uniref:uncharacterized protein LOC124343257 isoform X3 n=1 Tax=Daphnia pulicaria TaxID=35523 RepID=UPI001EEB0AC2|nr:uncharacterized protein LOC124343257 isoform X3 [Daphnia pulicaria]